MVDCVDIKAIQVYLLETEVTKNSKRVVYSKYYPQLPSPMKTLKCGISKITCCNIVLSNQNSGGWYTTDVATMSGCNHILFWNYCSSTVKVSLLQIDHGGHCWIFINSCFYSSCYTPLKCSRKLDTLTFKINFDLLSFIVNEKEWGWNRSLPRVSNHNRKFGVEVGL